MRKMILMIALSMSIGVNAQDTTTPLKAYNQTQIDIKDGYAYTKSGELLTGKLKFYNEREELIEEALYEKGLLNGQDTVYAPYTKRIIMTRQYKNGKLHGLEVAYDEDTQKKEHECHYIDGKKEDICKYYSEEGILIKEIPYHNGNIHGALKEYTLHGKLSHIAHFNDGQPEGTEIVYGLYDDEWKALAQIPYKNGLIEGTFVSLAEKTEYRQGKKEGKSFVLSPGGVPLMEITYHNDEAVAGITYCPDNNIRSSSHDVKVHWTKENIENFNNDKYCTPNHLSMSYQKHMEDFESCLSAQRCSYHPNGKLIVQ